MRKVYLASARVVLLLTLVLAGCGGGSDSTNPFLGSSPGGTVGTAGTFGNLSTAAGKAVITLETGSVTAGTNTGQTVATAKVVIGGKGASGIPVTFKVSGPAFIETGLVTTPTDSNGVAVTRITLGTVLTATNVIVTATAALGTEKITATVTFVTAPNSKVLSYKLSLSAVGASGDGTTVGPGSTVIATAQLSDTDGNSIANQDVLFEKVDLASPVTIANATVKTDSNGKAINFLQANNLPITASSSYDIILKGSAVIKGELVTSVTIFKIVRSAGNVIQFLTSKSPTDPDGTLNRLTVTLTNVDPVAQPSTGIVQLVPFQVLDENGVAMPRQSVAVGIYSIMGGAGCGAFVDSPEAAAVHTVTTDDNGKALFNAVVSMATPGVGSENSCSIIYRATTTIAGVIASPVFSYGGFIGNVKNELPQ